MSMMEYELFIRLKRVLIKYRKHCGEEHKIHRDIIAEYFIELNEFTSVKAEEMLDN